MFSIVNRPLFQFIYPVIQYLNWLPASTLSNVKTQNPNFPPFVASLNFLWIDFQNFRQNDLSFEQYGHVVNPLTPGDFWQKRIEFLDIFNIFQHGFELNQLQFTQRHLCNMEAFLISSIWFQDCFFLGPAHKSQFWTTTLGFRFFLSPFPFLLLLSFCCSG